MQRLRIRFCRGEELKFISHLDLIRLWERVLRRAEIPLAYTEGFNPHPRLSLAAPLQVGVTSEAELMDIFLYTWIAPNIFTQQISAQLPQSLKVYEVWSIGLTAPSLQSQVRFAEYEVKVEIQKTTNELEASINSLLSSEEIPWHHYRDTGIRYYNLRSLVDYIWLIDFNEAIYTLGMRLQCSPKGSGRPEQVIKALGFSLRPQSIHRTRLVLN